MEAALSALGERTFHARQIYRWIYRAGVDDIGQMTDLSLPLRTKLQDEFVVGTPRVRSDQTSTDGTRNSCSSWPTAGRSSRCSSPTPRR
jgi:23S rRNA (adenine2503-C2)-methyltransferase